MPLLMNFYQPVCMLKPCAHQNNWQVKRMQSKQKKKKRKKLEFLLSLASLSYQLQA